MKLVLTLLVRDEEDILEQNICHHLNSGVDWIRVTDNGSVDGTIDILEKYKRMKYLDYTIENEHTYEQDRWVSKMAQHEIENGADYLIHSDTDEMWLATDGNLRDVVLGVKDVAYVKVINYLPPPILDNLEFNFGNFKYVVSNPLENPYDFNKMESNKFLLYESPPKIITSNRYSQIWYGNHLVKGVVKNEWEILRNISIHHFSIRSYQHFEKKVVNGGSSYEINPLKDPNIGWHWKKWYEIYKDGNLKAEYIRLCRTNLDGVIKSRIPRKIQYAKQIFGIKRAIFGR